MSKEDADKLKLFTGRAHPQLAQKICDYLDIPLGRGRTELFPDGELIVKVDEDVRGRDCFVVQSTCHPVNAHLMELMIWIDCLKRASAKRVTAVIPTSATPGRTARTKAACRSPPSWWPTCSARRGRSGGVGRPARGPGAGLLRHPGGSSVGIAGAGQVVQVLGVSNVVFVSPDVGNVKRAQVYANMLGGEICIIDKRRKSGTQIEAKRTSSATCAARTSSWWTT
jgi:ribose-phosphate pyrophosphokinase